MRFRITAAAMPLQLTPHVTFDCCCLLTCPACLLQLQPGEPVLVYLRPEDEFLHKSCSWSFNFPVEGRPVTKDDLQPLRMVMLVEAPKIPAVRKALDAVVDNMAAGHVMA